MRKSLQPAKMHCIFMDFSSARASVKRPAHTHSRDLRTTDNSSWSSGLTSLSLGKSSKAMTTISARVLLSCKLKGVFVSLYRPIIISAAFLKPPDCRASRTSVCASIPHLSAVNCRIWSRTVFASLICFHHLSGKPVVTVDESREVFFFVALTKFLRPLLGAAKILLSYVGLRPLLEGLHAKVVGIIVSFRFILFRLTHEYGSTSMMGYGIISTRKYYVFALHFNGFPPGAKAFKIVELFHSLSEDARCFDLPFRDVPVFAQ